MMIGSKYLIFVDEAGSPTGYDPNFPVFVLSFVIISKEEYVKKLLPQFCELKLKYFNHTHVIFHERDIRKATGNFNILLNSETRVNFMNDMNKLISDIEFSIIPVVVQKKEKDNHKNLYETCANSMMEILSAVFTKSELVKTPLIFESRGKKEDTTLDTSLNKNEKINRFEIIFSEKSSNGFGLQLSDLTARVIGNQCLYPNQSNRAFDVLKYKINSGLLSGGTPLE